MKAKEMADRYRAAPTTSTIKMLFHECVKEITTKSKARGAKSDSAVAAVVKEQDDKWKAFSRLCPEVNPGGFRRMLAILLPDTAKLMGW
jgi:hypothetical protein